MFKVTPENFSKDPGRYAENQAGHMAVGAGAAIIGCVLYQMASGEYPQRIVVCVAIALFYLIRVEILGQGWQGWDTVEDTVFVVLYGSGAVLYPYHEITPGSPLVQGNPHESFWIICAGLLHLAIGAAWREYRRRRNDG